MRILFIGDIHGKPGRRISSSVIPEIRKEEKINFVIANGENVAGGFGITPKLVHKLERYGIDCLTSGNHIWNKEIIMKELDISPNLLRPANYPESAPGKGTQVFQGKIGVINLQGRTLMPKIDCPFRTAEREIKKLGTRIIIIDFHAESEFEKLALANWLDGKVSAVLGTHTHIQTVDEQILPHKTAYITDVGMTGSFKSVIGVMPEKSIRYFLFGMPQRFDTARGEIELNGVILEINEKTGKTISIKRIKRRI